MIVTGMFFAQVARASEGKLDVLGGVYDSLAADTVGTEDPTQVTLVVLVQRGQEDPPEGAITVDVHGPAGDQVARAEMTYMFTPATENGFMYLPLPLPLPVEGRYTFVGQAAGSEHAAAVALTVRKAPISGPNGPI